KHIRTLEQSGLIRTSKSGRVRMCEVDRSQLAAVDHWLDEQRAIWEARTDRLERFVMQDMEQTKCPSTPYATSKSAASSRRRAWPCGKHGRRRNASRNGGYRPLPCAGWPKWICAPA